MIGAGMAGKGGWEFPPRVALKPKPDWRRRFKSLAAHIQRRAPVGQGHRYTRQEFAQAGGRRGRSKKGAWMSTAGGGAKKSLRGAWALRDSSIRALRLPPVKGQRKDRGTTVGVEFSVDHPAARIRNEGTGYLPGGVIPAAQAPYKTGSDKFMTFIGQRGDRIFTKYRGPVKQEGVHYVDQGVEDWKHTSECREIFAVAWQRDGAAA